MQNYKVKILPVAQDDLSDTSDYIANVLCNPSAAVNLLDKIGAAFQQLQTFPFSGTKLNDEIVRETEYRFLHVENYLIFYTVKQEIETVFIMRILYGASDYSSILK